MANLSFSFTVSAENLTRVIDGVAYQNNYQDEVPDPDNPNEMIPNPESKGQFAKRMVREYIINCTKAYEANSAANSARKEAISKVEDEVEIG